MKNKILGVDPNEQVILEAKRHLIGLLPILIAWVILSIAVLVGLFFATANKDAWGIADNFNYLVAGAFALLAFVSVIGFIGARIYNTNELVITNENIIQILQFSIFNTQVSQLNLAKVQDVSVDQIGILQTTLNYGTIVIETAGEQKNFQFRYAHNPNIIAKTIIEAHEDYVKLHSGFAQAVRI